MSENAVETDSFVSPVVMPDDGDLVTGASVQVGEQALTSRTRHLFNLVGLGGTGSIRRREAASVAAIRAIAAGSRQDGDWVSLPDGSGSYRFTAASSAAEALPWVIQPTSGGGRWIHEIAALEGVNLATVSGGKVVEPVPNRIVSIDANKYTATTQFYYSNPTTFADVGGPSISFAVKAGDLIEVSADCTLFVDGGVGHAGWCCLGADTGSGLTAIAETERTRIATSANDELVPAHMGTIWSVGSDGSVTFKIMAKVTVGTNNVGINGPVSIRGIVIRP